MCTMCAWGFTCCIVLLSVFSRCAIVTWSVIAVRSELDCGFTLVCGDVNRVGSEVCVEYV